MKKIVAALLIFIIAFSFVSCSEGKTVEPEVVDKMVETGELGSIVAYYSVRNETEDGFYVQFNSALESFDYYNSNGTLVVFQGKEVVYDKSGNVIDRSELSYGQPLLIAFDGTAYDTDPTTIKAYKVTVAD